MYSHSQPALDGDGAKGKGGGSKLRAASLSSFAALSTFLRAAISLFSLQPSQLLSYSRFHFATQCQYRLR
jgi:hypothetical protein